MKVWGRAGFSGGLVFGLLSLASFASEADPRVRAAMRAEQSAMQTFCMTFLSPKSAKASETRDACLDLTATRYRANFAFSDHQAPDEEDGPALTEAHTKFCALLQKYSKKNSGFLKTCVAWNQARAELFAFALPEGRKTPPSIVREKVEETQTLRRKACRALVERKSLVSLGSRLEMCDEAAKAGEAVDRAILLGDF